MNQNGVKEDWKVKDGMVETAHGDEPSFNGQEMVKSKDSTDKDVEIEKRSKTDMGLEKTGFHDGNRKDKGTATGSSNEPQEEEGAKREENEEEEIEPRLNYQRLAGNLTSLLHKDAISAFTVSERFLVSQEFFFLLKVLITKKNIIV